MNKGKIKIESHGISPWHEVKNNKNKVKYE